MKYGNIAKAIAFVSLWIFASVVAKNVPNFNYSGIIWAATVIMSFVVIYLFDKGPEAK